MAASMTISQNPIQSCFNQVQHKLYSVQKKICNLCSTDTKVYSFLIIGRVLQAAALIAFVASVAVTFTVGAIALSGVIPAIALGVLGTHIAGNPRELHDLLQIGRPFVPGQPVGLYNSGNDCWLNSSLQLLGNSPAFQGRLRQIPEFSRFLDNYAIAQSGHQKVSKNIDTHLIRGFLSRETAGQVSDGSSQEDAAQLFEYLFQGPHAIYQLDQQVDGGIPTHRREPMIQIDLSSDPRPSFQQLFNHYFDHHTQTGQHLQLFFPRPPNELLIQAKRFYQRLDPVSGALQQGKIDDPLNISERLMLPNRFVRTGESPEYTCDGFTIHYGSSQDGGHYATYIKKGSVWWYCADSAVYEVPARQALAAMKGGYIFHYSRTGAVV